MKKDAPFNPADLPVIKGKVYHLDLKPGELSRNIIIVGNPERVPFIADEFFSIREVDRSHRGLRTITGNVRETGQRVSIVTSGMGTPSLEIVINEIIALNEIDFQTGKRTANPSMINIIRVGTSGSIQPDTELGTLIVTDYVIGLDNTGLFYEAPYHDEQCVMLEKKIQDAINGHISDDSRFKGKIYPYVSRAHQDVVAALTSEAKALGLLFKQGITVSNSGFFANQGRSVSRTPLTVHDIDGLLSLAGTIIEGLRIENMEMEASFLLHFMGSLGYRSGVICPVIDHRRKEKFLHNYTDRIRDAARVALLALCRLRKV